MSKKRAIKERLNKDDLLAPELALEEDSEIFPETVPTQAELEELIDDYAFWYNKLQHDIEDFYKSDREATAIQSLVTEFTVIAPAVLIGLLTILDIVAGVETSPLKAIKDLDLKTFLFLLPVVLLYGFGGAYFSFFPPKIANPSYRKIRKLMRGKKVKTRTPKGRLLTTRILEKSLPKLKDEKNVILKHQEAVWDAIQAYNGDKANKDSLTKGKTNRKKKPRGHVTKDLLHNHRQIYSRAEALNLNLRYALNGIEKV